MGASVTIIIPVFDAEQTLLETLNSISQEIEGSQNISWQVIAIDDGSTDGSLEILKQAKTELPLRIEATDHTGGPAKPRNLGIELADTKYVFFLDADDKLIPGGLSAAVELAETNDSDVVLPRLVSLDGRGVPRGMFSKTLNNATLDNSRIYWALNPMKLIRRSLLDDESIRFDSTLRRDEDQPFAFRTYLAAKKISILSDPPVVGVRYSPAGNNLTLRDYSPEDLFQYLEVMTAIMVEHNLDEKQKNFLLIRNWEIEIAREFIWKRLALLPKSEWASSFGRLNTFSKSHLVPEMLPKTSIRWRGIAGLVGSNSLEELIKLTEARKRALKPDNSFDRCVGALIANWIRLKATVKLPKEFNR